MSECNSKSIISSCELNSNCQEYKKNLSENLPQRRTNLDDVLFYSACVSFLKLRLEEKLEERKLQKLDELSSQNEQCLKNTSTTSIQDDWGTTSAILNLNSSLIALQNVDENWKRTENEILKPVTCLSIDDILPNPPKRKTFVRRFKNIFERRTKTTHDKYSRFILSLLCGTRNKNRKKSSKCSAFVSIGTQTALDVKISEEHRNFERKSNKNMGQNSFTYCINPANDKSSQVSKSCTTVIEQSIETKTQVTEIETHSKLRRQSSKLSICDEDFDFSDEFDAYWNSLKIVKSKYCNSDNK